MSRKHRVCRNCEWWDVPAKRRARSESGRCHAAPPIVFYDDPFGYWPTTRDDDWCPKFSYFEDGVEGLRPNICGGCHSARCAADAIRNALYAGEVDETLRKQIVGIMDQLLH